MANNQLPQDIMHVLFEGVIPYEMKHMLAAFFSNRYFSLAYLNSKIECFSYTQEEVGDKPSPLSQKALDSPTVIRQSCKFNCGITAIVLCVCIFL